MNEQEQLYLRNLKRGAFSLSLVAPSLQDFATEILTVAVRAGAIDRETVLAIQAKCVSNLKNSHSQGLAIDEEAEVLRKAISDFEKFLDAIVADAWEAN